MSDLARENCEKAQYEGYVRQRQTYQMLESVHCLLQDALNEHPLSVDPIEEALALVEQARELYMYLSVYKKD